MIDDIRVFRNDQKSAVKRIHTQNRAELGSSVCVRSDPVLVRLQSCLIVRKTKICRGELITIGDRISFSRIVHKIRIEVVEITAVLPVRTDRIDIHAIGVFHALQHINIVYIFIDVVDHIVTVYDLHIIIRTLDVTVDQLVSSGPLHRLCRIVALTFQLREVEPVFFDPCPDAFRQSDHSVFNFYNRAGTRLCDTGVSEFRGCAEEGSGRQISLDLAQLGVFLKCRIDVHRDLVACPDDPVRPPLLFILERFPCLVFCSIRKIGLKLFRTHDIGYKQQ